MKRIAVTLGVCLMVLGLATVQAADLTWDGTDMNWTEPDADSFGAPTYDTGDNVTFTATGAGTVDLQSGTTTPSNITINSTANYIFDNGTVTATGTLTKEGGGNGLTTRFLTSLSAGTVNCKLDNLSVATLSDSADPIQLSGGTFMFDSAATADLVLTQRPLVLGNANVYFHDNNDGKGMLLDGPLSYSGTGNLNIYLNEGEKPSYAGTYEGASRISANIGDRSGGVTSVRPLNDGYWELTGTNTYTGQTYYNSTGGLTFRGRDAFPSGTTIRGTSQGEGCWAKFLMDDAGTINLGNEIDISTLGNETGAFGVYVGSDSGTESGKTIVMGKIDFNNGASATSCMTLWSGGANGYRLQVGDVDLDVTRATTQVMGQQGFRGNTAPMTIAGTVKQVSGNSGNTTANELYLGGTMDSSTNIVSGLIKNPDDYPANPLAQPLKVTINCSDTYAGTQDSTWELSNTNTYSGGTTINRGKLHASATNALGVGDVTITHTSADLIINSEGAMASTATLTLLNNTTETLTLNTDLTVGALFLGTTPQANGEYTSSEAWLGGSGTLTVGAAAAGPAYWDIDNTTAGSGPDDTPDGAWDGTTANWNNEDGDGTAAAWSPSNTAVFAAGSDATGAYTVTVAGTRDISGLTVEEGSLTLTGGTGLRLVADTVISIAAGSTTTVANAISEDASARGVSKGGDGTLVLTAANSYSGPTLIAGGAVQATAADALNGGDISILSGASLQVTAAGGVDGGDISVANGATLALTDANAVADADGVTIEHTGGTWTRDTDITISNLTFNTAGGGNEDPGYTIGGNALNFIAGGTIDTPVGSPGTIAFTCTITGSPDVRIGSGDSSNQRYFRPGAGVTQTLGAVVHPFDSGYSDKGALRFGGSSSNNTIESVSWITRHYGYMYKEGTGKWTVNGNVEQGRLEVNAGTLIINGSLLTRYSGLQPIASGARLGGNLTINQPTASEILPAVMSVSGGGILSPGDGGVGTITVDWSASNAARTFKMSDASILEWEVGSSANDLIDLSGVADGQTETLDLDDFILKISEAGGSPTAADQLPVFTYDADVTVDMAGFDNDANNFDTTALVGAWITTGLSLEDDLAGTIYLTGLSAPVKGTIVTIR